MNHDYMVTEINYETKQEITWLLSFSAPWVLFS